MVKLIKGKIPLLKRKFNHEADVKEEFLKTLRPSTAKTVRSVLFKVDDYEQQINKSVYDFSLDDRDDFFISKFPNKSKGVIAATKSYIVKYINFCIDNNLVRHMENRFDLISKDDIDKYTNEMALQMKYLSNEEIKEALDKLVNNCDKLMMKLIYQSVRGRTEKDNTNEELINLRVEDAEESYETKKLKVWNNDADYRYVDIDDETVELLKRTISDDFYIINNGSIYSKKRPDKILGKGIGEKCFALNDTGYVFRVSGKNKEGKTRANFFNSRVQSIKDWVGNPFINITNLYFSGMIDYAIKLRNEKGKELDTNDYSKIIDKFNYSKPQIKNGTEDWTVAIARVKSIVNDYIDIKSL